MNAWHTVGLDKINASTQEPYKVVWAEACLTVTYVRNRVTSYALSVDQTAYLAKKGFAVVVAHRRVFGAACCYGTVGSSLRTG